MNRHCISWNDLPEETTPSGGSKRVMRGMKASLVMVTIPAGAEAARHSHAHEQFVQVISGKGTLSTEQGLQSFGPGSLFHFPSGTLHSARFESETVLVETNLGE